jgi:hypothetical protein
VCVSLLEREKKERKKEMAMGFKNT